MVQASHSNPNQVQIQIQLCLLSHVLQETKLDSLPPDKNQRVNRKDRAWRLCSFLPINRKSSSKYFFPFITSVTVYHTTNSIKCCCQIDYLVKSYQSVCLYQITMDHSILIVYPLKFSCALSEINLVNIDAFIYGFYIYDWCNVMARK